ncbi:MAG TPA: MBL fold metallo-hydrolase [Acidobacteriaceae bacterium]|jgi:L-ascorbate 6-phosphate lactonase
MAMYDFTRNDPHDRATPVRMVLDALIPSGEYMRSIRAFQVPSESLAIWFFGQNGFVLKAATGPLIGIDLYLTNSCAQRFAHLPFRLDRQLPVFVEPEDLDVDVFLTTHSHGDHADPETIRRLRNRESMCFVGPWQSVETYQECGIAPARCTLIHPSQTCGFGGVDITSTFALPTDSTDLNHSGALLRFPGGITFLNTGDTAWSELLPSLLPGAPDICAICINGGYNNLSGGQAARLIAALRPRVTIPCHYDMMINNTANPDTFRVALDILECRVPVHIPTYYEPWLYNPAEYPLARVRP